MVIWWFGAFSTGARQTPRKALEKNCALGLGAPVRTGSELLSQSHRRPGLASGLLCNKGCYSQSLCYQQHFCIGFRVFSICIARLPRVNTAFESKLHTLLVLLPNSRSKKGDLQQTSTTHLSFHLETLINLYSTTADIQHHGSRDVSVRYLLAREHQCPFLVPPKQPCYHAPFETAADQRALCSILQLSIHSSC